MLQHHAENLANSIIKSNQNWRLKRCVRQCWTWPNFVVRTPKHCKQLCWIDRSFYQQLKDFTINNIEYDQIFLRCLKLSKQKILKTKIGPDLLLRSLHFSMQCWISPDFVGRRKNFCKSNVESECLSGFSTNKPKTLWTTMLTLTTVFSNNLKTFRTAMLSLVICFSTKCKRFAKKNHWNRQKIYVSSIKLCKQHC